MTYGEVIDILNDYNFAVTKKKVYTPNQRRLSSVQSRRRRDERNKAAAAASIVSPVQYGPGTPAGKLENSIMQSVRPTISASNTEMDAIRRRNDTIAHQDNIISDLREQLSNSDKVIQHQSDRIHNNELHINALNEQSKGDRIELNNLKKDYRHLDKKYHQANGDRTELAYQLGKSDKKLARSNRTKVQLMEDRENERKRGNKFKKWAIGLGIGAGAATIGAGVLGSKYVGNKHRMGSMISGLNGSWGGRRALRRIGY